MQIIIAVNKAEITFVLLLKISVLDFIIRYFKGLGKQTKIMKSDQ